LTLLVDYDRALERDHHLAFLVVAGRLHRDDPDVLTRFGLPFLEYLGLGVDGVPLEDGVGQPYLVPAQVGENVLREVRDALAGDEGEGEGGVDQRTPELGLGRVVVI